MSIPPVQVWFSTAAGTFLNENPGFASAPPLALHRALRRNGRPGFPFGFSGCWRALAKGTAWAGFIGKFTIIASTPPLVFLLVFLGAGERLPKAQRGRVHRPIHHHRFSPAWASRPPFADAKFDMNDDGKLHVPIASCCSGARAAAAELLIRATSFGLGLELGWTTSLEGGGVRRSRQQHGRSRRRRVSAGLGWPCAQGHRAQDETSAASQNASTSNMPMAL